MVAFILCAWVDSNSCGVNLRRHFLGKQFIVVHGQNRLFLMAAEGSNVGVLNEFNRSPTPTAKNWGEVFRPFRLRVFQSRDPVTNVIVSQSQLLSVPHWLILLAAALVWLALLFWRARRRDAATTP